MVDLINRAHNEEDGKNHRKPWRWMIIDSIIIGVIALVAVMGNEPPGWPELWVMLKAFIGAFALQLAIERGIKRAGAQEET